MMTKKTDYFEYLRMRKPTFKTPSGEHWLGQDYIEAVDKSNVVDCDKDDLETDQDLMGFRYEMIKDQSTICDVGVGNLAFLNLCEERGKTVYGFDLNPIAVAELKRRNLFKPLYGIKEKYAVTCWNILEQMSDLGGFLDELPVSTNLYCSVPIIRSIRQYSNSIHFIPRNITLLTLRGWKALFSYYDFVLMDINNNEKVIDDIWSFHFCKE